MIIIKSLNEKVSLICLLWVLPHGGALKVFVVVWEENLFFSNEVWH